MIRDFQDAASVRSGHSHVTRQLVSFPPHPIPDGMLSRSIGMSSRRDGQTFGTRMVYRETFLQIQLRPNRFTHQQPRRMRIQHQCKIRDASLDRQPKVLSSLVRETLERIMEQTNNNCRFQILISTNSLQRQRLLAGR